MTELANEFSGASVISSSSFDLKYPPSAIIDGEYSTFWLTTGCFPQEIVIQLGEPSVIKGVELVSCGIRKVELGKCEGPQANTWEPITTVESAESDSEVQRISLQAPPRVTAQYLRIKILSGWADCVSVFKVSVLGTSKR
mmetsp:Transcript_12319/g.18673  ORF Transcript_12319/g.18673 Transcript_12319/m.18673 type:complete len:140 (-) Transcript_12319:135-554(-)|eukprot:CAMPEP_0185024936 /NCGR_PEP_ID=MMETSP1103-20130426/8094_1 /TAXON_ID=36769 /ORGANISM="Paraphysomonas bandaiensis, Strain Caron Lab Isolate" /LENGTH=139 /DNA_ID=CAMNT_0027558033 /DNA_START=151 /DNA_END=570 /DNA_ORIENTATION=-